MAGLRAHARRVVGTLFAVVFGVAFVSGTFIFTDTAKAGFYDAFARTGRNVDVDVQPPLESKGQQSRLTAARQGTIRSSTSTMTAKRSRSRSANVAGSVRRATSSKSPRRT